MKLFTLGYQSLTAEKYLQGLVNAGVGIVLDVREHAWSQRPDFVKSKLRNSLAAVRIDYSHIRQAGNPSKNRKTARTAKECLDRYRNHLRSSRGCLDQLLLMIHTADEDRRPACLTCYERDFQQCHRSILIEELVLLAPALSVVHITPSLPIKKRSRINQMPSKHSLAATSYLAPMLLPFM